MRYVIAVAIAAFTTLVVSGVAATVRLKADTTYHTVRLKADTTYHTVRLKADTTYHTVRLKADTAYRSYVVSGFSRTVAQASSRRLTVIISDLHLGPGRDATTGQWQPTENFRWADAFRSFLRAIDQAGAGSTDLVLNGDTFDLRQPIAAECRHADVRIGCTGAEALTRLERVLAAHAPEVGDLGAFARAGENRVIVVPGDHDAALVFTPLSQRVVAAVNAPGRVNVSTAGYWVSSDGAVYAEHGQQIDGDPFRFSAWPEPLIRDAGNAYLERTWGEQLLQDLFDKQEPRYPILDNVVEVGAGLDYLALADPAALRAAGVGPLLKFFASRTTWQQFRLDLDGGDVQPPEWDLPAARRRGAAFLVESLVPDDPFRALAQDAVADGSLSIDLSQLTDREIIAICDYRAALRRARRRLERSLTQIPHVGPAIPECARLPETRGSAFEYFWRSRDVRFADRLDQVRRTLDRGAQAPAVKVFVYGHRHLADNGFVPVRGAESPMVINAGAWQRTVTPYQLDELIKTRGPAEAGVLRQLQPEDLPACYGVAWIDPYVDRPSPRVRFWRGDGRWGGLARDAAGIANACGREAAAVP